MFRNYVVFYAVLCGVLCCIMWCFMLYYVVFYGVFRAMRGAAKEICKIRSPEIYTLRTKSYFPGSIRKYSVNFS